MTRRGFALSSCVPDEPMTAQIALALTENLRRLEMLWAKFLTDPQRAASRVWGCRANRDVLWTAEIGAVDPDPDLCVVQLVMALPAGTPDGVVAYHTLDANGRPLCLISYVAAGRDWPSAMSHELCEATVDPDCDETVKAPDGTTWDVEVADSVEGSDYEENGVRVSNAVGPAYFQLSAGPLDIAGAVTAAFEQLPTGYHVADGSEVFGERVFEAKRAHVMSEAGRPGQRRKARGA
jgi:hypothetical protein